MDGVHWQMYFVSGFATKGSGSELQPYASASKCQVVVFVAQFLTFSRHAWSPVFQFQVFQDHDCEFKCQWVGFANGHIVVLPLGISTHFYFKETQVISQFFAAAAVGRAVYKFNNFG